MSPPMRPPMNPMVVPMRVLDLSTCRLSGQPTVLLEDAGQTCRLAFYLPADEATRLSRALGLGSCPCSPVLDLVEHLVATLPALVLRAELDGDEEGISGRLVLGREALEIAVPCHPADAMSLALRAGMPITATAEALAHGRPVEADAGSETAPREPHLQDWLRRVRPADFRIED